MLILVGSPKSRLRLLAFLAGIAIIIGIVEYPLINGVKSVVNMVNGRLLPIYSVDSPTKKVAISFDATWGCELTPTILDILKENDVKTTFFLAGYWLEKYPEMVKKIAADGHELGNHSYTHPHCNSLSVEQLRNELIETNAMIKSISGQKARLFRPPFGEYNNTVVAAAEDAGFKTIMWDVDSLDWKDLSADDIVNRVMSRVKPGSIVLFHNAGKNTPVAIRTIIRMLKDDDYEIVPVSRLLLKGDTYVDHTGMQKLNDVKRLSFQKQWEVCEASNDGGNSHDAVKTVITGGSSKVITEAGNVAYYQGDPIKQRMSFAMNVAWGEEYLPDILKILSDNQVKITFYFVGSWVKKNPELTKKIYQAGHEIANHGYTHGHPTRISDSDLKSMVLENDRLLSETIGGKPSRLFSPPYGELDNRVIDAVSSLGFKTTMWTLDTIDWQRPSPQVILERILNKSENGAIVLMHPTEPTLRALPEMISELKEKGYELVPVSEIIS